jgi:hypothetical protein
MTRPLLAFVLAAVLAGPPELSFSEEAKLQHDPFARPALASLQHGSRGGPVSNGKAAAAEPRRRLNLQAVMMAGPKSIANVDGMMVRIGDQVYGYRLVAVHERQAVFEKNNKRFTLFIRGDGRAPNAARDTDAPPMRGDAPASSSPQEQDSMPPRSGAPTPQGAVERQ